MKRRLFLKQLALTPLLLQSPSVKSKSKNEEYLLSAENHFYTNRGGHALGIFNVKTQEKFSLKVPYECHSVCMDPRNNGIGVMLGRRPHRSHQMKTRTGLESYLFDLKKKKILQTIDPMKDHTFYGHGTYSVDGMFFLTTENHKENPKGTIVVRSSNDFSIVGEFPSFGYAPHDLTFTASGKTLIVANGGDHQEQAGYQSEKLKEMKASLSFIDFNSKKLKSSSSLKKPINDYFSIRHLLFDDKSRRVFIGMNNRQNNKIPSMAQTQESSNIDFFLSEKNQIKNFGSKSLSIAKDKNSFIIAFTHPNEKKVSFWKREDMTLISAFKIPGTPHGIAYSHSKNGFYVSTEAGFLYHIPQNLKRIERVSDQILGLNASHLISSRL